VRTLRALTSEEASEDPPSYGGTWVVVGDPDSASLEIVRGLGQRGVSKVLLVADGAPTSDVTMQVLNLAKEGVRCTIVRVNPHDADDRSRLQERLEREDDLQGVVVRLVGSRHEVLGRAGDVGVRQVATLENLPFLLELAQRRILWLPAGSLDHGDGSPWSAVLAPAAAQLTQARHGAVLCGAMEAAAVGELLGAARPGDIVLGR
jgi:hypothetical protein